MRDLSRHHTSEWAHGSTVRVSPQTFDALSHVLGRTIAQRMQQHATELPATHQDARREQSEPAGNAQTLRYEWAARHLLAKMRVETN